VTIDYAIEAELIVASPRVFDQLSVIIIWMIGALLFINKTFF